MISTRKCPLASAPAIVFFGPRPRSRSRSSTSVYTRPTTAARALIKPTCVPIAPTAVLSRAIPPRKIVAIRSTTCPLSGFTLAVEMLMASITRRTFCGENYRGAFCSRGTARHSVVVDGPLRRMCATYVVGNVLLGDLLDF